MIPDLSAFLSEFETDAAYRAALPTNIAALKAQYGAITVDTAKPVAIDSPDHIQPRGTKDDNSYNRKFNAKLRALPLPKPLRVLDLGCSGGAMVRTFIEGGDLAVGIEGSDYSKVRGRAEWSVIPEFLFTADVTAAFSVRREGDPVWMDFSAVTLWEVLEHIHERDLYRLFDNIHGHLDWRGIIIASICTVEDVSNGVTIHQTVKPEKWWMEKLDALGWQNNPDMVAHFHPDWVRGYPNAPSSFHVVLTRKD